MMTEDDKRKEARESFTRWQGVTRDHFSSVSNLVLGLSAGLLAYLADKLLPSSGWCTCAVVLSIGSLVALALSVGLSLWCAINRLHDFRGTAMVARKRNKGESVPEASRRELRVLGKLTWRLFWWQLVLFAVGVAFAVAAVVVSAVA